MKGIWGLVMLCASLAAFGQSEFSQQRMAANPPFKLEITANIDEGHTNVWDFVNSAQTVVKAGSPIVIAVRKTNISKHEIDKASCVHDDAFGDRCGGQYDVRDSHGNSVELTKPKMADPLVWSGPAHVIGTKDNVLQPGESTTNHDVVSEGFDISKPGKYTIQLSQHVRNDPKSRVVRSNILTVTVLPAGGGSITIK